MFKALAALAAVTVCCLGNEYPAKSQALGDGYWQQQQQQQMQQQLDQQRREAEWQRVQTCPVNYHCN